MQSNHHDNNNESHLDQQLENLKKYPPDAIKCLGYNGDHYYYISKDKPQITVLTTTNHTQLPLMGLMPLEFWEYRYGFRNEDEKLIIPWKDIANELMEGCRKAGVFSTNKIRGGGVWLDQEKVVINLGSKLWVDGKIIPYTEHKSDFIYSADVSTEPPREIKLGDSVNDFLYQLERIKWKDQMSAKLLLGWLFIAPLAGALPWRPHIWITGASGTGKSFLLNQVIRHILKEHSWPFMGSTTEAGLRQTIGASTWPIIFDELETDDDRSSERVSSIVELFRQASSESDARVGKGTAIGKSISYTIKYCGIVASIRPNLQHEQDKNRFTLLELLRHGDSNEFLGETGIQKSLIKILNKDFLDGFYEKSVKSLPKIIENYQIIRLNMVSKYPARFCDQFGMILAGYYSATREDLVGIFEELPDLSSFLSEIDEKDEDDCLDHILETIIRVENREISIREIVERIKNSTVDANWVGQDSPPVVLGRHGMRVLLENGSTQLAVKVGSKEFKKILKGTKWSKSAGKVLSRLPGGSNGHVVKINGSPSKCVIFPI